MTFVNGSDFFPGGAAGAVGPAGVQLRVAGAIAEGVALLAAFLR